MGLVRNMIIAQQFGLGSELDAFFAAFKIPDLLFTIVAGGALATAFIPIFTDFITNGDREGAWRLASAITNLVVLVVSTLALITALAAPWLVRVLIAPGFEPALQAETAIIMRLVLLSTIFFGISAIQSSVLHSFKSFLLPALAPIAYPVGIIIGAIWLTPLWGVRGLAIGAVLGSIFHLLVKVPGLIKHGFRWLPVFDLRSQAVRRVLFLMGPRVLDLGVFHLTLLATTNLASRLAPGSVSAVEWGWEFMQLPETIIGTAVGLVIFPTLADLAARQDLHGLRQTLGSTLRMVIALTVPATAGLILLGRPLLLLVYQRGAFDSTATDAVFVALSFFAVGLVGHSCLELAARAFFALQDMITPLVVAVAAGLLYVALSIVLMNWMGHGGLALANSVAVTLEVIALLWLLRGRLDGIEAGETMGAFLRILIATGLMAAAIYALNSGITWEGIGTRNTLVRLALTVGAGVSVYLVAGWFLGVPFIRELPGLVRRGK